MTRSDDLMVALVVILATFTVAFVLVAQEPAQGHAVEVGDNDVRCSVNHHGEPCPWEHPSPDVMVVGMTVEWTWETVRVGDDYYLCKDDLEWSECQDTDVIGYKMGPPETCCVKQVYARLGLRSDGVVVWREP